MTDVLEVVSILREGGVIAFLVLVVIGGHRRWWVHGWLYDRSQDEVRYWRDLALKALDIGEAAVSQREAGARHQYLDDKHAVRRRERPPP